MKRSELIPIQKTFTGMEIFKTLLHFSGLKNPSLHYIYLFLTFLLYSNLILKERICYPTQNNEKAVD